MNSIIQTIMLSIASLTVASVVMIAIVLAADKAFGKKYSALCRYVVWTLIILRMCIPLTAEGMPSLFKISVPETAAVSLSGRTDENSRFKSGSADKIITEEETLKENTADSSANKPLTNDAPPVVPNDAVSGVADGNGNLSHSVGSDPAAGEEKQFNVKTGTVLRYSFAVWFLVLLTILGVRSVGYTVYSQKIRKSITAAGSEACGLLEGIARELGIKEKRIPRLYVGTADSPMLFGFVKPAIILPETHLDTEQIREILCHEMIHFKRRDLWVKLACMIAMAVNWFNPFVYIASSKCIRAMELSCDETILSGSDRDARINYSRSMLAIIDRNRAKHSLLTTRFDPKKSAIVERFANILEDKKKKRGLGIIAGVLILCILSCGVVIGMAAEPSRDEPPISETDTAVSDTEEAESSEAETQVTVSDTSDTASDTADDTSDTAGSAGPPAELRPAFTAWAYEQGGSFYGQGTDRDGVLGSAEEYAAVMEYALPDGITVDDIFVNLYSIDPDSEGIPPYMYELDGEGSVTNVVTIEAHESFTTENGYAAEYKRIHEEGVFLRHMYNVRVLPQSVINISFKSTVNENAEAVLRDIVHSVKYTDLSGYPSKLSRDEIETLLKGLNERECLANSAYSLPLDMTAEELTNDAGECFLPFADNDYGIKTEADLMRFVNKLCYGDENRGGSLYTGDSYFETGGELVNMGKKWMVVDGVVYRNTAPEHAVVNSTKPDYESIEEYSSEQNTVYVTWDSDGDGITEETVYRLTDGKLYLY